MSLCMPFTVNGCSYVKRYAYAYFIKGVGKTVDTFTTCKHGFIAVFDFRLIVTAISFLLL